MLLLSGDGTWLSGWHTIILLVVTFVTCDLIKCSLGFLTVKTRNKYIRSQVLVNF